MQPLGPKPTGICSPATNYVHVDNAHTHMMPDAKEYQSFLGGDEYLTDLDKHEESIVWKGGLKLSAPKCIHLMYSDQGHGINKFYDPVCWQQEANSPGNQRLDWWAATWPDVNGSKHDGEVDSFSNTLSDAYSDTEGAVADLTRIDMEKCESAQRKIYTEGGANVETDQSSTGSTQSLRLEMENASLWNAARCFNQIDKGCRSLVELDLPLSQESFKVFSMETLAASRLEAEGSKSRCCEKHFQGEGSSLSYGQTVNMGSVWQEGFVFNSSQHRFNIDTEELDRFVSEAKRGKEWVRKDMEEVYQLRQKVELEELAAQHAKTEAASSGLDIFLKVEDIRQQISQERAEYEMHAADVHGEKSVLSMEARELKLRLLETQAEQAKALSLLDSIRCSLSARLDKASMEKHYAMEEAEAKVKKAEELLASEQATAQKLEEKFQALEAESEACKKLREFLIDRGNIVDSLQGEMAVVCEDVLLFKEQVDEGIPLSAGSCSLSWSRISHVTEQFSTSPRADVKDCRSSRPLLSESPCRSFSSSNTSALTLRSATSERFKSRQSMGRPLHPQNFSPGTSMDATAEGGSNEDEIKGAAAAAMVDGQEVSKEIIKAIVATVIQVCDAGKQNHQWQEEDLATSKCAPSLEVVVEML